MNTVCQQSTTTSPRQNCPQTFQRNQKIYTPYRFEELQTSQSYLLDPKQKKECKRVNSPGLPDNSFRRSHKLELNDKNYLTLGQVNLSKSINKRAMENSLSPSNKLMQGSTVQKLVEIGLLTDRNTQKQQPADDSPEQVVRVKQNGYYISKPFKMKSEESQNLHSFNPQQFQQITVKEDKQIQVTDEPEPYVKIPEMQVYERPMMRKSMKMVDKLETDKLSLEIFMSEKDENSLIFTGITKRKVQSPEENKKMIMDNLHELFARIPENIEMNESKAQLNNYIKMESLEQSMYQNRNQQQYFTKQSNLFSNEFEQISNHLTSDFMSVSSAQSIQLKNKCFSQQQFNRPPQSLQSKKANQKWNNYTRKPQKQDRSCVNKQSKSPFLKNTNVSKKNTTFSQPKLQQISQNILRSTNNTPTQISTKKLQQAKSLHSINKCNVSAKIKSFHVTPEKIENSIFDERFYNQH